MVNKACRCRHALPAPAAHCVRSQCLPPGPPRPPAPPGRGTKAQGRQLRVAPLHFGPGFFELGVGLRHFFVADGAVLMQVPLPGGLFFGQDQVLSGFFDVGLQVGHIRRSQLGKGCPRRTLSPKRTSNLEMRPLTGAPTCWVWSSSKVTRPVVVTNVGCCVGFTVSNVTYSRQASCRGVPSVSARLPLSCGGAVCAQPTGKTRPRKTMIEQMCFIENFPRHKPSRCWLGASRRAFADSRRAFPDRCVAPRAIPKGQSTGAIGPLGHRQGALGALHHALLECIQNSRALCSRTCAVRTSCWHGTRNSAWALAARWMSTRAAAMSAWLRSNKGIGTDRLNSRVSGLSPES